MQLNERVYTRLQQHVRKTKGDVDAAKQQLHTIFGWLDSHGLLNDKGSAKWKELMKKPYKTSGESTMIDSDDLNELGEKFMRRYFEKWLNHAFDTGDFNMSVLDDKLDRMKDNRMVGKSVSEEGVVVDKKENTPLAYSESDDDAATVSENIKAKYSANPTRAALEIMYNRAKAKEEKKPRMKPFNYMTKNARQALQNAKKATEKND